MHILGGTFIWLGVQMGWVGGGGVSSIRTIQATHFDGEKAG